MKFLSLNLLYFLVLHDGFKMGCRQYFRKSLGFNCKNGGDEPKINKPQTKSTKLERIIDDFVGKKYGYGQYFYGKRLSDLSEEDYQSLIRKDRIEIPDEDTPMEDNAILIIGDLESIGQWIAFDLAEKGFRIRIATENLKDAVYIFGLPGVNVDMIELGPDSNEQRYIKAVQGAQAIVLCGNFNAKYDFNVGTNDRYLTVVSKTLDLLTRAGKAGVTFDVQKIALVSRVVPWIGEAYNADFNKVLNKNKLESDEDLPTNPTSWERISSIIGQKANKFQFYFDSLLGSVDNPLFSKFHKGHVQLENLLKQSNFGNYVIIRAPSYVAPYRKPSLYELKCVQSPGDVTKNDIALSLTAGHSLSLNIGVLDFAECVVQSLLSDLTRAVTFTICEDPGALLIRQYEKDNKEDEDFIENQKNNKVRLEGGNEVEVDDDVNYLDDGEYSYVGEITFLNKLLELFLIFPSKKNEILDKIYNEEKLLRKATKGPSRPFRNSYYSILNMSPEDIRTAYVIRREDSYLSQLSEDEVVENYWKNLFFDLKRDSTR